MKLKVGQFARLKSGYIVKVLNVKEDWIETDTKFITRTFPKDFVKASHNIINLIEEKDLLEIEYFSLRYEKRVTRIFEVTYKEGRFINLDNAKCQFMLIDNDWTDNDKELEPIIKSIVTKEMYSSV